MKIQSNNGKYTFIKHEHEVVVEILRYGEAWHSQNFGYNALVSIMCELDAARVVLEAARKLGDAAPPEIKDALERHDRLVDDREPPTGWSAS